MAAAHLEGARFRMAHVEQTSFIWAYLQATSFFRAHLEEADLRDAHAERAVFREAHLEGASLVAAHLENANLRRAHFEGKRVSFHDPDGIPARPGGVVHVLMPATLSGVFFDTGTALNNATLGNPQHGFVSVSDVRWGGINLAVVRWREVIELGDEQRARQRRDEHGRQKDKSTRLDDYETAVRANRQLATALRDQGLNEDADSFAYRAQLLQREVLRRPGRLLSMLGSWFLDLVAGYGYRPMRSFLTYLLVVVGFAAAYVALGDVHGTPLSWNEAVVVSMTAFHGRGFFSAVFQPGDLQAAVAAVEAFIGLLIEIVFIATFTQRFFAR